MIADFYVAQKRVFGPLESGSVRSSAYETTHTLPCRLQKQTREMNDS